jgi:nitroreductase
MRLSLEEAVGKGNLDVIDTFTADEFSAGAGPGGEVWLAVQNLLLAARALGLGAVPTTLRPAGREAVQGVVGLPEAIVPLCLIPLGHPTGDFGRHAAFRDEVIQRDQLS